MRNDKGEYLAMTISLQVSVPMLHMAYYVGIGVQDKLSTELFHPLHNSVASTRGILYRWQRVGLTKERVRITKEYE